MPPETFNISLAGKPPALWPAYLAAARQRAERRLGGPPAVAVCDRSLRLPEAALEALAGLTVRREELPEGNRWFVKFSVNGKETPR